MKGGSSIKKRLWRLFRCLIILLVIPVSLLVFAFGLPAQYNETFLGELSYKADILTQSQGQRIIIAGGSGVAFGLRSDLLAEELAGYSIINLGMYAGLGSTVTLDIAAHSLQSGDVVVFIPEQSEQTLSMYFNAESMWQAADGHWSLLKAVRDNDWSDLVGQFPYFAAQKARYLRDGNPPNGDGIYARSSFNAWGDIDSPLRTHNIMNNGYDPNMLIRFDDTLPTADFLSYLNDYAAMCQSKGVAFYYRFCPMNAAAVSDHERTKVSAYQEKLGGLLACPILGQADNAILDEAWFYDTNFHLNSAGAIVNTAMLATELKTALGINEPVHIPLPNRPDSAEKEMLVGDDSDTDCFLYQETADGMLIIGLTPQGLSKSKLILPAQHNGKPVFGFTSTVFQGNAMVEEIVIQRNISTVEDRSFDGCTALKRLTMQNVLPSQCSVGEGLLTGTSASIYVSAESLGRYKTSYFWAIHAARIQSETETRKHAQPTEAPTQTPIKGTSIRYDGNGGALRSDGSTTIDVAFDTNYLRTNTLQGTNYFTQEGYVQIAWNTAADGSGTPIGLGSRITPQNGLTLYAHWIPQSPETDFTWEIQERQVWITGYQGTDSLCVIPASIEGLPVRRICSDAFRQAAIQTLVLSPELYTVEENAFSQSTVQTVYLYDSLYFIYDNSFADCPHLTTLHINAASDPVYSISYYATFANKYDWLLSLSGQPKIVLFSGSSTRYAYDSAALHQAYPAYQVANMGVYAYTNALPQLEIIRRHMAQGDVLLHAPEFDTLRNQLCYDSALDEHFFAMMEANYDMAAELDLSVYTNVFDSLGTYLCLRISMPTRSYADRPNRYDDDGNRYQHATYNQYGDFILSRPNGRQDVLLQYMRAPYTPTPFTNEKLTGLNQEYQRFLNDGISVYFTYTPRNRSSLTDESTPQARAALDALLKETLCVPIISDIEASLYSGIYFFLIDSHLSDDGVRMYTEQIIKDLEPWLKGDNR